MNETATLWGLFVASFLAATLLPGGSEAVLFIALGKFLRYWVIAAVA